jgi:DNA-binding NarL/FixJ family response regulator
MATKPLPSDRGRILMIDDSELLLSSASARLTREGYDVITSTQTVGNARHLRSCDLVIVDFHMPGIDGGGVLTSLREAAVASSAHCAFFLYTSDPAMASRYREHGFDGVLLNKGNLESLVNQVHAAMRVAKLRGLKKTKKGTAPGE